MEKNRKKVLIAAPVHKVLLEGLEAMGYDCKLHIDISQATAPALIADCEGVVTSTRLQMDKSLLDAAPMLKWIGRMGSGMEVVDVAYAEQKSVRCFSSPEGNSNAVAEHALGMLLALMRRIVLSNNELKNNTWLRDENRGFELEGKTIGIIGYGHAGSSLAKKLTGFDMQVMAYDKYASDNIPRWVMNCDSLEPIFREADIVSFHVPQSPETRHYFNDDFLNAMNRPFVLINTSRGNVVSTSSLYKGIDEGKVLGACLDVFEAEPPSKMPDPNGGMLRELLMRNNVIATPHIAGYTYEALFKMSKAILDKVHLQVL